MVENTDSKTVNIRQKTIRADLIVTAVGKANVLRGEFVKKGVVVIDVGTLVIEDQIDNEDSKKIVGDVDFASVEPKASRITPVPGGVGPVTVISLLENAVELVGAKQ